VRGCAGRPSWSGDPRPITRRRERPPPATLMLDTAPLKEAFCYPHELLSSRLMSAMGVIAAVASLGRDLSPLGGRGRGRWRRLRRPHHERAACGGVRGVGVAAGNFGGRYERDLREQEPRGRRLRYPSTTDVGGMTFARGQRSDRVFGTHTPLFARPHPRQLKMRPAYSNPRPRQRTLEAGNSGAPRCSGRSETARRTRRRRGRAP
jgi:hypothetical protein